MALTKEQEKMIVDNYNFVYYIASKLHLRQTDPSYDDAISELTIGMIKAIQSYNQERNCKFTTYASRVMINEYFMYCRKERRQKNQVSIQEVVRKDKEGKEIYYEGMLYDEDYSVEDKIINQITLNQVENELENIKDKDVYNAIFVDVMHGMKQKEVADKYDTSQSYVSRIVQKKAKMFAHRIRYF